MTGQVAGLVLAAGAGTRFGAPKALVELDGERLVDRAVRVLREGGADPVVVVTGAAVLDVPGAVVAHNPAWPEGLGSSLRAGLDRLTGPPALQAAAVLLVDQPGVTAGAVERVVSAVRGEDALVVATFSGRWGHPVVLGRTHWAEAAALAEGDRGARALLRRRAVEVVEVECGDIASGKDVDTVADLLTWTSRGTDPAGGAG